MRVSTLIALGAVLALVPYAGFAAPEKVRTRNGGYLGMFVREKTPGTIVLERIQPGSGAEAAGLKAGDVVTAVNGIELDNGDELIRRMWSPRTFTLNIRRGAEPLEIRTSSKQLDGFSQVGESAPRFSLPARDGSGDVALDTVLARGRPVVLVFGSFT
jgi:membrane-associated protease RseP (regulator of RpoE activity)